MACINCGAACTIKAHLIPKSIVKQVEGTKNNYAHVPSSGQGRLLRRPSGQYDGVLLCGSCDNILGKHEAHLLSLLNLVMNTASETRADVRFEPKQSQKNWKIGLLSIVYKFTQTKEELGRFRIGPYEDIFADSVFRLGQLPSYVKFSAEHVFTDLGPGDPTYNRDPFPLRIDGVKYVGLTLMNVCWRIKIDKRPAPPPFADWSTEEKVQVRLRHWTQSPEGRKMASISRTRSDVRRYLS